MTSLQLYESFLIKLNRGDSNINVNVPRGKFVVIYNEQAKQWLHHKLRIKVSTNEIDELKESLSDSTEISFRSTHLDHKDFVLPDNFFDFSHAVCIATKGNCERVLEIWPEKDKNVRVLLKNSNYKPSFDYEETLCSVAGDALKVYFDSFDIEKVYLSYYKEPLEIDIEGYTRLDGNPSSNIDPDLSDFSVNQIINRCVSVFHGITENKDGFEISKNRITTEE